MERSSKCPGCGITHLNAHITPYCLSCRGYVSCKAIRFGVECGNKFVPTSLDVELKTLPICPNCRRAGRKMLMPDETTDRTNLVAFSVSK